MRVITLRQLLAKFVELLLQGNLGLLGGSHFVPDSADGGQSCGADDDSTSFTGSDVGSGEDNVLLVLVDGARVGHGLVVLDHRHGLTGEDGLVDTQGGGVDLDDPEVSRQLVSDGDLKVCRAPSGWT